MTIFIFFLVFIGIATGLAWFLIFHDHGEKEPIGALWIALALGLFAALPAVLLERSLLHLQPNNLSPQLTQLGLNTLGVGVIEEACKFLPLAFFIYKRRYFNEHTDGVIYFALAGLGFGLPENILYTAQFGSSAGFARIILTPFFHAATTAIVGYYLARGKMRGRSVIWVALPLVLMMLLHGLYDFGLMSNKSVFAMMSVGITFALSGALFVLFLKAQELDQDMGISTIGHNSFCRSCGCPNPEHHLYCTHCGKNA